MLQNDGPKSFIRIYSDDSYETLVSGYQFIFWQNRD